MDLSIESGLNNASNEQILDNLVQLFEWTQDYNWPVAPLIIKRISKLGSPLTYPLTKILGGDDFEWKWTIINFLIPLLDSATFIELKSALIKITKAPTEYEREIELDKVVLTLLKSRC
jgi:hypothetical protein